MFKNVVLFITVLLTALSAGIFYAYACSVNPGLHRLSDVAYLSAMQSINRAIQNPAFFVCFMGPVLLLPWSAWWQYKNSITAFKYLLFAAVLYIGGVFGVTMVGNVPLNQALEVFNIAQASPQEFTAQRTAFETPWNDWHRVRTIAAVVALILTLLAAFFNKKVLTTNTKPL